MSTTTSIYKGNIVTPTELIYNGWIVVRGEEIVRIDRGPIPSDLLLNNSNSSSSGSGDNDASSSTTKIVEAPFIVPGFVDVHNHGLGGADDVTEHWLVPSYSQKELARCGTLSVLASLILAKDTPKRTDELVKVVHSRCQKYFPDAPCVIEGIHCEGPVIADCGGLPAQDTSITLEKFKTMIDSMSPFLKIMTISPSLEANFDPPFARIQALVDAGVRPSLGHDRSCNEQQIRGALSVNKPSKDYRMHTTHFCNVQAFHHRDPSLINFCLCRRFPTTSKYEKCGLPPTTEVIGDLVHVHGVTIQGLLSARPSTDVCFISDCISAYKPGKHLKYNNRGIIVRAEGGCYLADKFGRPTLTLAGSTVTIADQFFTLISAFGVSLVDACMMTATTPAKIANLDDRVGSIEVGKKANLLLLNGSCSKILKRVVYGSVVGDEYGEYNMLRPAMSNL